MPRLLQVSLLLFFIVPAGRSEIRNFGFSGTLNVISGQLPGITNGTPFTGFYMFDLATPDSNPDTTVGDYWHSDSSFGIFVQVGDYSFRTDPARVDFLVEVVDRPLRDNYLLRSYTNIASHGLHVKHISWQLDDPSGTALDSAALPDIPPVLESFDSMVGFTIEAHHGFMLRGHVHEVKEIAPVIPRRPVMHVHDALEVSWKSELGYFYQIESSPNMETWQNVGEPIPGTGNLMAENFPRRNHNLIYRVEIIPNANATVRTVGFSGTLGIISGHLLGITNGTPFTGFYTFDTATPDSSEDPTLGRYRHHDKGFGVFVQVGDYSFRTDPTRVDFLVSFTDRPERDYYSFMSYTNVSSHGLHVKYISWQLHDPSGTAWDSADFRDTPPDLESFDSIFGLTVEAHHGFMLRGHVHEVKAIPPVIPEQPGIHIHDAVEVSWTSALGYVYQIQSSSNMKTWQNIGEPIPGTGDQMVRYFRRGNPNRVYRLEIANYP